MQEMEDLAARIAADTKRLSSLRNKMADFFHKGEDGTENVEVHGYQVKVVRKLGISCNAEAKEQLAADDEELYDEVFPEKVVRSIDSKVAKAKLDELQDYVTTKQGLPTVTFKRVES